MNTATTSAPTMALGSIETVLAVGDLSKLSTEERTRYLLKVCESLSLNPYTRPFQYIVLSGRLTLYATRDAAEQLRKLHGVSIRIVSRERADDLYIVQAEATDRQGRVDTSLGVVSIRGKSGDDLANMLMKAETKAKRRVTLSICGLGMLDETEVGTIPGATVVEQPAMPTLPPPTNLRATAAELSGKPEPPPVIDTSNVQAQAKCAEAVNRMNWPKGEAAALGERLWPGLRVRDYTAEHWDTIRLIALDQWHEEVDAATGQSVAVEGPAPVAGEREGE